MTFKHNNTLCTAIVAFSALSALTSCSNVPEDERFIYYPLPEVGKNVLIAEFSGTGCTNCPYGAQIIHDLIEEKGGNVLAVSFHPIGSPLTNPLDGFMIANKEALEYYTYYGNPALPAASIDGLPANDNRNTWGTQVDAQIELKATSEIYLKSDFDPDTRQMAVDYQVHFTKDQGTPTNIIIWITEDKIIGPQIFNSVKIEKYEHNHIFRARATDMWGIELDDSYLIDDTADGTVTFEIPENWNVANCNVVGLLIDRSNKLYLQAAQVELDGGDNFPENTEEE